MPITKSAKKQLRQSEKRRLRNRSAKSGLRTAMKKVRMALEGRNREVAAQALAEAVPLIDKAAAKGFIHANAGARYKSRLTRQLDALSKTA
ncbi:MAG: 30S ribosomal protein S20 [Candidatus Methylomirabilaceae bacterium]